MAEWQRLVIQIERLRAELDEQKAQAAASCTQSNQLIALTRARIAESRELLFRLADGDGGRRA